MQHSVPSFVVIVLLSLIAQFLRLVGDLCQDLEAAHFVYSISL